VPREGVTFEKEVYGLVLQPGLLYFYTYHAEESHEDWC